MREKEEVEENEEEAACGDVAVYSPVAKIEAITENILEMNTRRQSRIKKEKEEVKENKGNNFYILDSIGRARMVQQFQKSRIGVESEESEEYSCIR